MRAALPHAWGLPIGQAEMLAMPRRSRSARLLSRVALHLFLQPF
jgi:hypothetical protein